MNKKTVILSGVLAVMLYVFTVIFGGIITPGYSHYLQAVSELVQSGALHKPLLDVLFNIYNLLMAFSAFMILTLFRGELKNIVKAGIILVIAGSLGGILMAYFPMDPLGSAMTIKGVIHIILAILMSFDFMAAMLMIGLGMRKYQVWRSFTLFSIICFIIVLISGGLSPVFISQKIPGTGFLERITIGTILIWYSALCIAYYRWIPAKD